MITQDYIVWIDTETSGRDAEHHQLLEIGAIITDRYGNMIGAPFEALIEQTELTQIIKESDPVSREMHEKNNLWLDLWNSRVTPLNKVDESLAQWITTTTKAHNSEFILGGNSPYLDRDFIRAYLPITNKLLSHLTIDVTSIALTLQGCRNELWYVKRNAHRALPDIIESIEEYKNYLSRL